MLGTLPTSLVHLAARLMYSFQNNSMSPLSILCPWKFLNSVKTWFRDNSKNIQSYCPLRKEMLVIATALKTYHKRWRLLPMSWVHSEGPRIYSYQKGPMAPSSSYCFWNGLNYSKNTNNFWTIHHRDIGHLKWKRQP